MVLKNVCPGGQTFFASDMLSKPETAEYVPDGVNEIFFRAPGEIKQRSLPPARADRVNADCITVPENSHCEARPARISHVVLVKYQQAK